MSIKNEHPLNLNHEIKSEIINDDKGTDKLKEKGETLQSINIDPELKIAERPIFKCANCEMIEWYDCFSNHVPFNRYVRTKTDFYLARDPFSARSKKQFLILGSVCSVCDKDVCVRSECSIFYSKFFCSICARKNIQYFPSCIQNKIKSAYRI